MAGLAAEVTQIEAYVQWSIKFRFRTDTFAARRHSLAAAAVGHSHGEYRPDVVGPECRGLIGNRQTRYAGHGTAAAIPGGP
jgi:hypothetical protein